MAPYNSTNYDTLQCYKLWHITVLQIMAPYNSKIMAPYTALQIMAPYNASNHGTIQCYKSWHLTMLQIMAPYNATNHGI